mgnify:CR=1 FL=1
MGSEMCIRDRSYDDIDIIQNDLSIIMHHLYIGTEFLDLNNGMPYNDSEF